MAGTRRRNNQAEQDTNQFEGALEHINGLAQQARGRRRNAFNELINDVREGMAAQRPISELFGRLQQAQQSGMLSPRDLAEAQIQLNNTYGRQQGGAAGGQQQRAEKRRGRILMPNEMNRILGRGGEGTADGGESGDNDEENDVPQNNEGREEGRQPNEQGRENGEGEDEEDGDEEQQNAGAENRNAPRNQGRERQERLDPIERDEAGRPRRFGERRPAVGREDRGGERENEDGPLEGQGGETETQAQQLAALRNEIEALRDQIRDLLAQRRGGATTTTEGTATATGGQQAAAGTTRAQGVAAQEGEMIAGAAPDQPAAAQAAAPAAPDQIPAQPPAPPVVHDEWPNWPEVQQAPPHPEYTRFVQQLLCQLQSQGINLQPDARLQHAINHMLHARDAHIAGLRGWDTTHGAFTGAGLQGPDRVAAGNALLMRQNYWGAFEIAMDAFKIELFRFIFDYKRAAFGPQATPEQLRVWARQEGRQIAINCIFPVALTMYEDMERRVAMSLENTQDRNIFQRMGDVWNRMPRWGRILTGAGIAAGIGGLIGAFVGPALALSYGAYRGARALAGGTFAAITQGAVDSWLISPHYQRQRQQLTDTGRGTAEANINRLTSGWEGQGLDWYARYGNLSDLMRTIDRDALLHLQQLNELARREGRTRLITGLVTGLAGGFAGGAIYDAWAHPTPVGALVPPSGTKTPLPVETANSDVVRTIKPGDNLWKVSRGLVADGTITHDQWKDAWQHSTDKVISHGVEKTVPFHTIGLVHPNDQLVLHHTPDGHVRFDVIDYAKDKLHLGDNAEYARLLQEHGKPLPQWLKDALHIQDHGASHTVPVGGAHHGSVSGAEAAVTSPDTIVNFPHAAAPGQIVIDNPASLLKSFPTESLADQDRIMSQLNNQIAGLRTELRDPNLPVAFQAHDQELLAKAIELQGTLQDIHAASLENFQTAFSAALDNRHIPWKFYENVKDIRVADYLWMTDQMHHGTGQGGKIAILGALTDNKDASYSLEKFIKEFNPGRFEKKMTLDAFFKHVPPTESYSQAA